MTRLLRLRVWDLPTRAFHWTLAVCVIGAVISIKIGGDAVAWHFRFGYAVLTLMLFRAIWGLIGPRYARFTSFPIQPVAAWRALRGAPDAAVGHSPAGALSAYALMLGCTVQAFTGLFASDSIIWDGPLRKHVSNATSDLLTSVHLVNRGVLILLIILHIAAIVYYKIRRGKALTAAMLSGDRLVDQPALPARDDLAVRLAGAAVFLLSAWAVAMLVR